MGAKDFSDHFVHGKRAAMSVERFGVVKWANLLHELVSDVALEVRPILCGLVKYEMQLDSVPLCLQFLAQNDVFFGSIGKKQHQLSLIFLIVSNFHQSLINRCDSTASSDEEYPFHLQLITI